MPSIRENRESVAALVHNGLHLISMVYATMLECRENGRLQVIAALFAAVHAGTTRAFFAASDVSADHIDIAFAKYLGGIFIGIDGGVFAKDFALQIAKQCVHRIVIAQYPAIALAVLRKIDCASTRRPRHRLIFRIERGNERL